MRCKCSRSNPRLHITVEQVPRKLHGIGRVLMTIGCPLCRSLSNSRIEVLEPRLLSRLYKTRFGIDLAGSIGEAIELRRCACCNLKFYYPVLAGEEAFYESLQKF